MTAHLAAVGAGHEAGHVPAHFGGSSQRVEGDGSDTLVVVLHDDQGAVVTTQRPKLRGTDAEERESPNSKTW